MALSVLFSATKCPTKTPVPQFSLHGAVAQFWFMRPNWKATVILGSLASLIQGQPLPPPSFFLSILPGMQIWHWRESCLKEYEATAWEWKIQFKDGRANGWELGQWWFPGGIHRTAHCYSSPCALRSSVLLSEFLGASPPLHDLLNPTHTSPNSPLFKYLQLTLWAAVHFQHTNRNRQLTASKAAHPTVDRQLVSLCLLLFGLDSALSHIKELPGRSNFKSVFSSLQEFNHLPQITQLIILSCSICYVGITPTHHIGLLWELSKITTYVAKKYRMSSYI